MFLVGGDENDVAGLNGPYRGAIHSTDDLTLTLQNQNFVFIVVLMQGGVATGSNLKKPHGKSRCAIISPYHQAHGYACRSRHGHGLRLNLFGSFDKHVYTFFLFILSAIRRVGV